MVFFDAGPSVRLTHLPLIMAPRFLHNLVPQREKRAPFSAVIVALKGLTWVQWAQFVSGSVFYLESPVSRHHL